MPHSRRRVELGDDLLAATSGAGCGRRGRGCRRTRTDRGSRWNTGCCRGSISSPRRARRPGSETPSSAGGRTVVSTTCCSGRDGVARQHARSVRWWRRRVRRHGDSRTTDSNPGTRSPTGRRSRPARSKACARRQMSFICWRWMCMPLTKTASAHSKSSSVAGRRFSSMNWTGQFSGQIGRDQQQALRRHEGADAVGQGIGVFECAEGRGVAREDAQNTPDRSVAFSAHRTSPNHVL